MSLSVDIDGSAIKTAIRSFLLSILPASVEVVSGLDNLVSMPAGDFVTVTFGAQDRLALNNIDTYNEPVSGSTSPTVSSETPWKVSVDLDVFSNRGQQYASLIAGILRSTYAVDLFPSPVVPLDCSDPKQVPFTTAAENWLQRWRMELLVQVNVTITADTESATALEIGMEPIDQNFAP